jgi:predicted RNA binding protein YcfA (HicA-like mRNA interferase family)
MKAKQLIRKFREAGVEIDESRGKGGHYVLRYGGAWTTLPVHGSKDVAPVFIKDICRQIGLDWRKVL